jgi:toxin ParE1/3/4
MTFDFHPDALAEYRDAALYYAERRDGLDFRFIKNVEKAIRQIVDSPTRFHRASQNVRCFRLRVFPYSILYTIEDTSILIVALMHFRREPGYWKNRIKFS